MNSKTAMLILYLLQALMTTILLLFIGMNGDYLYIHEFGKTGSRFFITLFQLAIYLMIQQVLITLIFFVRPTDKDVEIQDHLIDYTKN